MRFKTIAISIFVASVLAFGGAAAAQGPTADPAAQTASGQSDQGQQRSGDRARPGRRPMGEGMMGGGMMMPMMGGPQRGGRHGEELGGPLQRVSRLLAALDDPRVRTVLGLTEQQADSLRKIIVGTETFTIKTGADIAVDSIDLRELLRADKPDRAAVMSKGDQISKSTSQLINHYLDAMLAAKAVLTPEQQKMIRTYIESGAPGLPVPPARP